MNQKNTSINIKELSYLTGFSVSTVSKALNDKIDISLKTKRLVMGIAKKHNYVPNSFAVGLRNNKSHTVAIILPQVNVTFYGDLLYYFQQIADSHQYRIMVFQSFESQTKEIEYLKSICDGSADGAIVLTNTKDNFYSKNYTVPVLTLPIAEVLSQDVLKEYCFDTFGKLLAKIS